MVLFEFEDCDCYLEEVFKFDIDFVSIDLDFGFEFMSLDYCSVVIEYGYFVSFLFEFFGDFDENFFFLESFYDVKRL